MHHTVYGVDIAKSVFQLHWVDQETGEVFSKQIKRAKLLEHFANRGTCLIGMEACGGAQHWARRLSDMGHQVKLMAGKAVKAFVPMRFAGQAAGKSAWIVRCRPAAC